MRLTDVAFGIPFLPFAMVVISIAGPSLPLVDPAGHLLPVAHARRA